MNEDIKKYLDSDYYGCFKGQYNVYCPLKYEELNSFLKQAGIYGDLEIVRVKDQDTLLDTNGQFVNRIWPEIDQSEREYFRGLINEVATTINNDFMQDDKIKHLDKIDEFIDKYLHYEQVVSLEMEMS